MIFCDSRVKYDVVVIPFSKISRAYQKILGYNAAKYERYQNRKEFDRFTNDLKKLDIQDYKEPTEMPDIDNFDYENEKRDVNPKMGSDYDGLSNGDDKIVGGDEVDINLYPYHVAYGTNCGGAIIDRNWVITAGHCGVKPYIKVGSKYFNQGVRVGVKKNHIHPFWSAVKKVHPFDYDFQLLELEGPLIFNDNVQPIKIAHIEDMVVGTVVSVTGWGNTEENGPYSHVLRAVRVPIISKETCQNVPYPYFKGTLTPRMFCAGYTEGEKDACQGDSGGPAVSQGRLLGMVSFGYGCATPGAYGVYSKVAKVRSWIEGVTELTLN
ncbi:unnamed protein product [Parnassius apollo]|uniref:Vitamin K-dependent protein C n=1 Tax=Parnassius apollo TaxID=110799 RepID=A0A8S3XVD9_PARAO|nr:unnamed protein product [Parnassius apollo]